MRLVRPSCSSSGTSERESAEIVNGASARPSGLVRIEQILSSGERHGFGPHTLASLRISPERVGLRTTRSNVTQSSTQAISKDINEA